MTKKPNLFGRAYMILIFIFLYMPILLLMIFSFNDSKNRAIWGGFTLNWYKELFQDSLIIDAVKVTLSVAVISAIISTLIGTFASLGIVAMKKNHRKAYMSVNNIPVMDPDIIMGVSLMLLFIFLSHTLRLEIFQLGYVTLLIAHITFNIPMVILSVMPKMRQMDKNLYEAALDLGATPMLALRKVVFPQIMPGVITGMIMAFTMSIDDVVVSYFTSGPTSQTLGVLILSMTKKRVSPEINALCTIMFLCVLLLLLIVNIREVREERENIRKSQNMPLMQDAEYENEA